MKKSTVDAIVAVAKRENVLVRADHAYSGRGMMGSFTSAVVVLGWGDLLFLVSHATLSMDPNQLDAFRDDLRNVCQDNLGYELVVY